LLHIVLHIVAYCSAYFAAKLQFLLVAEIT
jgi:hypothetical protein